MGLVLNYRETLKSSGRNIWKLKQLILYYSFKNAEAVLIVNKMTSTSQEKNATFQAQGDSGWL